MTAFIIFIIIFMVTLYFRKASDLPASAGLSLPLPKPSVEKENSTELNFIRRIPSKSFCFFPSSDYQNISHGNDDRQNNRQICQKETLLRINRTDRKIFA